MSVWKPHTYQAVAVDFMVQGGCGNLWLDPGLGKTSICLAAILEIRKYDPRPALVVCPLRPAHLVWPAEVEKWDQFNHLKMTVLHGSNKDKLLKEDADVYVVNFNGLQWLQRRLGKQWPFSMLIVDESTSIKDTGTQRYKVLRETVNSIPRRWCLTGTPASNSLLDIFGPQYIVDRGHAFSPLQTMFRSKYFTQGYSGYDWRLTPGAEEQIYDALSPSTLRLAAKDYIDMPELVENDVFIELPPEARAIYDGLEKSLVAEIEDGSVTALNGAIALMKCQQVANGGVYMDVEGETRETRHLHDEKIDAVKELVAELDGKGALVVYHFKHDLERLKKAFPQAPVLGSGLKPDEMQYIVNGWNAGVYPVLLAHSQSIGHGLNMQAHGEAVIWASLTYSRELYDQLNARLVRQGSSKRMVVVHRIIAKDTVDEDIIKALARKDSTQQALLSGIQARQQTLTKAKRSK